MKTFRDFFMHVVMSCTAFMRWVKNLFRPEKELDELELLHRGLNGDARSLELFLEKSSNYPTVREWMVLSNLDPFDSLDGDSTRESQLKYVVRECRPACYNGDFPVVDGMKLKKFLQTPDAYDKLDKDFHMRLTMKISHL